MVAFELIGLALVGLRLSRQVLTELRGTVSVGGHHIQTFVTRQQLEFLYFCVLQEGIINFEWRWNGSSGGHNGRTVF